MTQRGSEPFAAFSSNLDQELVQQLVALAVWAGVAWSL
jgi:hypothetical protein